MCFISNRLLGVGDSIISDVSALPDPCPQAIKVRRSLNEKQKLIYAPMSDVAGILYDKDAVYVNVRGSFTRPALPEKNPLTCLLVKRW
jgi:ribosome biogenesis protein BMS1